MTAGTAVAPDGITLTDQHADNLGSNLSVKLRRGMLVVVYADGKNGRIVVNIYPRSAENTARVGRIVTKFKARIFEAGKRLDESRFGGK